MRVGYATNHFLRREVITLYQSNLSTLFSSQFLLKKHCASPRLPTAHGQKTMRAAAWLERMGCSWVLVPPRTRCLKKTGLSRSPNDVVFFTGKIAASHVAFWHTLIRRAKACLHMALHQFDDLKSWWQELKSCMRQTVWHISGSFCRVHLFWQAGSGKNFRQPLSQWLLHLEYYTKLAM